MGEGPGHQPLGSRPRLVAPLVCAYRVPTVV